MDFYRDSKAVSDDELLASATDNLRFVCRALADDTSFDTSPSAETGRARALSGIPRSAVTAAYRVAAHAAWDQMTDLAAAGDVVDRKTVLAATARFWDAQDRYTDAMTTAYHETATYLVVQNAAEQAALTEALLQGRPLGEYTVWDVASLLKLPSAGPFVVVAAAAPRVGAQPLPDIAAKLRALNVFSAWRLLPDTLIGIVHLPSASALESVVALLERAATTNVGVSPTFDDLSDTAANLRYARVALAARGGAEAKVCVFSDSVLAVAAVSAPEVSRKLAQITLGGFDALPAEERQSLGETFAAWVEHRGSVTDTAAALFCHRNTVRNRLHRIEEHTGRSLAEPRDIAELCLAFEARLLLPDPA
ncbi:hypothetical protein MBRU_09685 [Mycolicibacterium brumae DSM 44177]|nr:hypothetical protein MBRU_09685 [Mycolicibacterium brumae DSM 44177]